SNRAQVEVEPLIGFFANTLALRMRLEDDPSFAELLRAASRAHLDALSHQQLPFEKIVEDLQPERALNRNPLFQVMLVLQNVVGGDGELRRQMDSAGIGSGAPIAGTAKFDLTLTAIETADSIICSIEYSTELFDHATIERIGQQFARLLSAVVADPDQRALAIDLFTDSDREAAAAAWGPASFDPDGFDVVAMVEAAAARDPDGVALEHGDRRRSFAELAAAAATVQRMLAAMGVSAGDRVAIRMPRGIGMVVAVLAVMRAGAVYVPVDAGYPEERQRFILADSGARVLIAPPGEPADAPLAHLAMSVDGMPLDPDSPGEPISAVPLSPRAPAYVIYTSGSTGVPKGVVMSRRALANLIRWDIGETRIQRPRTLQFSPLSFDVSFQEIASTWALGAPLVLVDEAVRRDPDALWRLLIEARIERIYLPFVALQQLADAAQRWDGQMPPLRDVITAGEQLIVTAAIVALFERLDGAVLRNQYGPTETHIMTEHVLDGAPAKWPTLPPIGKPMPNSSAHVLDARMQPTVIGAPGEIFVGGACVAIGYHGLPEQTAERFLADPFDTAPDARLYRTGDRARRLADGSIQYLGRGDRQTKVRGFRIEPGEIEAALTGQGDVAAAAVVVAGESSATKRLIALVVPALGAKLESGAVRRVLAGRLPEHMIPATIAVTERIPLTPSGKIDRTAALRLAKAAQPEDEREEGGVTPLERMIAGQWAELLGVERLGAEQDFFAAGGHSLLATRALSRIAAEIGIDLPVRHIFAAPTPRGLAAAIVDEIAERLQIGDAERLLERVERRSAEHIADAEGTAMMIQASR
ncbi:MAG: amino acid adenylation domain-containing protein, partial [Novosphingobium sp.]